MDSDGAIEDYPRWVAPFGDLRVEACLRLTGAYRSLPRPSSPACANLERRASRGREHPPPAGAVATSHCARPRAPTCDGRKNRRVVELTGIEPAASALQGRRSPS